MVKLFLLFGFSAAAYSSPLQITGGSFFLSTSGEQWSFVGDGFSANGASDALTDRCGVCFAPFHLVDPGAFSSSYFERPAHSRSEILHTPWCRFSRRESVRLGVRLPHPSGCTADSHGSRNI